MEKALENHPARPATPTTDALRASGVWNRDWDAMDELDPEWTERLMRMIEGPLNSGVLDRRTIELIFIAIDASVTHMHAPGTRRHIRRALEIGVKPEEIMVTLELVAILGMHTLSLGAPMLKEEMERLRTRSA
jgi:alkylhydroperoxidase/carboxymuconolactone decarboxylase family protein YurZ